MVTPRPWRRRRRPADEGPQKAAALLRDALRQSGLGVDELARQVSASADSHVSRQTIYRYLSGRFPRTRQSAAVRALDRFFAARLQGAYPPGGMAALLWPGDLAIDGDTATWRSRGRLHLVVWWVTVSALAAAALLAVASLNGPGPHDRPPPRYRVDGSGPGQNLGDPIAVWDRPAMTDCGTPGCDREAVRLGTVRHEEQHPAVCVVRGQVIRNGPPGAPGYYQDDRWVRVDVGGQRA